jgi:hypothetical protein
MSALLERLFHNDTIDSAKRNSMVEIGVNVLGPGGGQWTLTGFRGGEFHCLPGLLGDQIPTLTIDSNRLQVLLEEFEQLAHQPADGKWDVFAEKIGAAMTLGN